MMYSKTTHTDISQYKTTSSRRWLLALAFAAVLIALIPDIVAKDVSILGKRPPIFNIVFAFRTLMAALSSWLIVRALASPAVVSAAAPMGQTEDLLTFAPRIKDRIVWAVLLLSSLFVAIFLALPKTFTNLSTEDSVIETLSALLWFSSSGVFLWIFVLLRRSAGRTKPILAVASLSLALVFFVMGGEEISWFQRILSISSPAAFQANQQKELNLHNFYTDRSEIAFDLFSFLFLIILPFTRSLRANKDNPEQRGSLAFFIPGSFVLFASAICMAYNYDRWNIIFEQLKFFITLFILLHSIKLSHSSGTRALLSCVVAVYILTQVLFLAFGGRTGRIWDVTEYFEFLVAVSFFIFSIEMMYKARSLLETTAVRPNAVETTA
ncbi:MAG TPA: hypothetical protein VNA16_01755 [Abditibacteriaceae bacterium]|nr:hypothetical protein [Abditibacteriaceae bacterium]